MKSHKQKIRFASCIFVDRFIRQQSSQHRTLSFFSSCRRAEAHLNNCRGRYRQRDRERSAFTQF
ncbi:MAG: hypothetical protein QOH42_877 [Blastocatellia bacterium]|nr:hypothetical protein [Blastocatellia bacterium]